MRPVLMTLALLHLSGLPLIGCHHSPLPPNATPPRAKPASAAQPPHLTAGPALDMPSSITPTSGTAPPATRGRHFAEIHCASCHAIGDRGSSPNPAAKPFRDIVKVYPPEQLQEAFVEGISVGHAKMPPFTLSPDDTDDLIAYLRTLER